MMIEINYLMKFDGLLTALAAWLDRTPPFVEFRTARDRGCEGDAGR